MDYNNINFRDVTINAHLFPTADAQSHTAGGDMANELLITMGAGSDLELRRGIMGMVPHIHTSPTKADVIVIHHCSCTCV